MAEHRLLVIEDEPAMAGVVARIARDAGFDVCSVCHVNAIARVYHEFRPDVIVLDILMPDMDGFEVLRFLHERHSRSQIVLLSGENGYISMASRMAAGLELAIVAAVPKPFRTLDLRQVLQEVRASLMAAHGDAAIEAVA